MGVSGAVAAAILVAAVLAQGSAFLTAQRNADGSVEQAREVWQRRHEAMQGHRFSLDDAKWSGGQSALTLKLNNTGLLVMNQSRVHFLLDGVVVPAANFTSRTIGGVTTDVWTPDQVLQVILTAASRPTDVAAVSPWGLQAVWRDI